MTEIDFQRQAYERLSWEPGFIAFRFNCGRLTNGYSQAVTWGRGRNHAGVSDLAALVGGKFMVWIELKQPGKTLSDKQVEFADLVTESGGIAVVVENMSELETVITTVREMI